MRRITPAEVIEAYRVTGLKPVRKTFRESDSSGKTISGCAMTAIALASGFDINKKCIADWADINFGGEYAGDFRAAFDGYEFKNVTPGYADGIACAAAVFGKAAT